jgi:hypothetical protein
MSFKLLSREMKVAKNYLSDMYGIPQKVVDDDFENMFGKIKSNKKKSSNYSKDDESISHMNNLNSNYHNEEQLYNNYEVEFQYYEVNGTHYLLDPVTNNLYDFYNPTHCVGKLDTNRNIIKRFK